MKNIMVKDGDFVEMGQPLMTLSQNKRLQLRAEVPQRYYKELPAVVSANFKTPYDDRVYETFSVERAIVELRKGNFGGRCLYPRGFRIGQ